MNIIYYFKILGTDIRLLNISIHTCNLKIKTLKADLYFLDTYAFLYI